MLRVVFFGTPAFAVPTLQALLDGPQAVVGVVTQPDRPAGRGREVTQPPVKALAVQHDIPVLQPEKIRNNETFLEQLAELEPDVIVVLAYGKILPPAVLELPPHGCINVHASLLPRYRGAAPIQWALIRGETVTGVTTMQMDAGMDTGDVLLTAEIPIAPTDTAGTLHETLARLGAELLTETLERLEAGTLTAAPQDDSQATLAPLLKKSDGRIDWTQSATDIFNRFRGVTPWPGAFTLYGGESLKIHHCTVAPPVAGPELRPGDVVDADEEAIRVATGDGVLAIQELQPAGKRRMTAAEWQRGHDVPQRFE